METVAEVERLPAAKERRDSSGSEASSSSVIPNRGDVENRQRNLETISQTPEDYCESPENCSHVYLPVHVTSTTFSIEQLMRESRFRWH